VTLLGPIVTDLTAPGFDRIVPRDAVMDRIPNGGIYSEGPVWNAREGCLYFSDSFRDMVLKWVPGVGFSTYMAPTGRGLGMIYDTEGRLVVAGWSGRTVWRIEHDGSIATLASHYDGKKLNAPNDVAVRKSDNAIYWTDMAGGLNVPFFPGEDVQQYLDFQGVLRVTADGSLITLLADDFDGPNGICFSPNESLLYVNDSRRRHIRVFDVLPDGSLANGRLFYDADLEEPGGTDGMRCDVEGNVWCRAAGGIHVIDPSGKLLGRIVIEEFSSLCFGDADWRTVYVAARGDILRLRVNVAGVPV